MKRQYIETRTKVVLMVGVHALCGSGGNVKNVAGCFMGYAPTRAGSVYL